MNLVQIEDWHRYKCDGEQFLRTACAAHEKRTGSFSPETLYNLTCMAIEKLTMTFLIKRGDLVENYTMGDLARSLENHLGDHPALDERLSALDTFQEIFDLDEYSIRVPSEGDSVQILSIDREVRSCLLPFLD